MLTYAFSTALFLYHSRSCASASFEEPSDPRLPLCVSFKCIHNFGSCVKASVHSGHTYDGPDRPKDLWTSRTLRWGKVLGFREGLVITGLKDCKTGRKFTHKCPGLCQHACCRCDWCGRGANANTKRPGGGDASEGCPLALATCHLTGGVPHAHSLLARTGFGKQMPAASA